MSILERTILTNVIIIFLLYLLDTSATRNWSNIIAHIGGTLVLAEFVLLIMWVWSY